MNIENIISTAAGRQTVDTLFINGKVINVFTGEILEQSVAVKDGYICGFGDYDALDVVDVQGMYAAPGFMDAHVHIESSMVTPAQFSKGVLPCGTTTVIADPHEIANVLGIEGIEYMMKSADTQSMNILFALPSCVPATDMETSGAHLDAGTIAPLLKRDRIVALAEMMNYPGVIFTDPDVMAKLKAARNAGKTVDGHAPGLSGKELYAYASAGIFSDHECTTAPEALEKMRLGIHIMVREGTCARNLDALLPAISDHTWQQMMWCTDDRHPEDILTHGHVDYIIRKAIGAGVDPVRAIQMGTINCARYFGIKNAGAIAPGRRADMVLFRDILNPVIEKVFVKGVLVAENGQLSSIHTQAQPHIQARAQVPSLEIPETMKTPETMNFDPDAVDFSILCISDNQTPARAQLDYQTQSPQARVRVIQVMPDQVVTEEVIMDAREEDGELVSDVERDMLKIAVIERYSGKTGMTTGFVTGLGLSKGAIASSVAHDSHNIIVAGAEDADMLEAVKAVKQMKGGFAVVCDREVLAALPLPAAGLMSHDSLQNVNASMNSVVKAAQSLGSILSDPFMTLGFLALPVIPKLKITDRGLVDVEKFTIVRLFV